MPQTARAPRAAAIAATSAALLVPAVYLMLPVVPPGFPAVLAVVFRISPSFPANVIALRAGRSQTSRHKLWVIEI